jgi:flavin reductase (DIM6/NTAB) family NADH-FMN oxidoreductase RutF
VKEMDYKEIFPQVLDKIIEGAFLVVKAGDLVNVMTIGWALFGFVWRRPIMMIAVRESRYTFKIIEKADSFSVSIPLADMAQEIKFCGTKSGRDVNKFRECNFSIKEARKIHGPILDIPGYHYECKIIYKNVMDPLFIDKDLEYLYATDDHHTLYFGEIVACQLLESA